MQDFVKFYINDLSKALKSLNYNILLEIANEIERTKNRDGTVFLVGNGGSSATPSHSAGDWSKELGIKTLCLTDNVPSLTAFANDTSYDNIFKGQLEVFISDEDLVIGYSGSGNSENVINAIKYASQKGIKTIGISGNYEGGQGGVLADIVDTFLMVNTKSMERIEDMHLIINHIIKEYIKNQE